MKAAPQHAPKPAFSCFRGFAGEFDLQGAPALARRGNCRFGAKGKICTACTEPDIPKTQGPMAAIKPYAMTSRAGIFNALAIKATGLRLVEALPTDFFGYCFGSDHQGHHLNPSLDPTGPIVRPGSGPWPAARAPRVGQCFVPAASPQGPLPPSKSDPGSGGWCPPDPPRG